MASLSSFHLKPVCDSLIPSTALLPWWICSSLHPQYSHCTDNVHLLQVIKVNAAVIPSDRPVTSCFTVGCFLEFHIC